MIPEEEGELPRAERGSPIVFGQVDPQMLIRAMPDRYSIAVFPPWLQLL